MLAMMTFRDADAIALAELLGLDSEFVKAAYRALSQ